MTSQRSETRESALAPGGSAQLGGRVVARIGFGVMQLESRPVERDDALGLLRNAISQGINHIDTAQFYGDCNELIRAALAPYPRSLVLVTKVGADRDPDGKLVPAQRPAELRAQVEANLASLGTEQVGVVNLRRLDAPPGLIAEGEQKVDLDSQLAELIALRAAGKIGAIGLSNVSAGQIAQAQAAGIACVQNSFSLLDRRAEPALDACRERGIAWVPYFPLGSAFPSRPKVTDNPVVTAIAADLAVTPAQVGLAWLLAHYGKTLLIPGTTSPAHLDENIASGGVRLTAQQLSALDQLA
ncbi:MAG TPA: aldo/keto reductase [Streptosporangiaceae bacterium]|jgi:hypothetical protein